MAERAAIGGQPARRACVRRTGEREKNEGDRIYRNGNELRQHCRERRRWRRRREESGRWDLNPRHRAPKARALPDRATPRSSLHGWDGCQGRKVGGPVTRFAAAPQAFECDFPRRFPGSSARQGDILWVGRVRRGGCGPLGWLARVVVAPGLAQSGRCNAGVGRGGRSRPSGAFRPRRGGEDGRDVHNRRRWSRGISAGDRGGGSMTDV